MTIRLQIFFAVFALFLGVGIFGSVVTQRIEREAVRQAFDDDARTAAITFAEFIEPADVAAGRAGRTLDQTRLGPVWDRLQRWVVIKRFFLLDPATGRPWVDTAPDQPLPAADAVRGLGAAEVRMLPLRRSDDGHAVQPLVALAAGGTALAGVEVPADDYLARQQAIQGDAWIEGAIAAAIGIAMGLVLGGMVSRPIGRLSGALERIGQPEFPLDDIVSPVREISDLGNTLGVMHRVLGETVEKGRLSLLDSDYYRSERGFAEVYRRQLQPPPRLAQAGAESVWLTVGSPPPPAIAGTLALGSAAGAAFAGLAGDSGELVSAVRAHAAAAFLSDRLVRLPLTEAAVQTQGLFGLSQLAIARWEGEAVEFWRSDASGGDPAADAGAWKAGLPVALACLGPVNRDRVAVYLETSAARVGEQTLAELPPLLDAAEPGLVLILRRKG